MRLTKAQQQFLMWLRDSNAPAYAVFMAQLKFRSNVEGLGGIGDWFSSVASSIGDNLDTINSAFTKGVEAYGSYRQQRIALEQQKSAYRIQMERAKAGVPPVTSFPPYNQTLPPLTLQPLVERVAVKTAESVDWNKRLTALLPYAIGGGLLWAITTKKKGR